MLIYKYYNLDLSPDSLCMTFVGPVKEGNYTYWNSNGKIIKVSGCISEDVKSEIVEIEEDLSSLITDNSIVIKSTWFNSIIYYFYKSSINTLLNSKLIFMKTSGGKINILLNPKAK